MNCEALAEMLQSSPFVRDCHVAETGSIVFTTDFRHSDGDAIEFALSESGSEFLLSDCGETTSKLFLDGFDINRNETVSERARLTLARTHGVDLDGGELFVACPRTQLGSAILELGSAIVGIENSVVRVAERPQEQFAEEVTRLLVTHRIPFELNRPIDVDSPKPLTVQFFIESAEAPRVGFALPGQKRIPPSSVKVKLYDFGRLRKAARFPIEPFIVVPDRVRLNDEQIDMLEKESVRSYALPRQEDDFISWLRAA
jgi:hypothetical protein